MKICFFGIYNPDYSRNRVLISGFKKNGCEIIECRADPKEDGKFFKYFRLFKEYKKIKKNKFDYVIVAFPGHTVVWLAKLLFRKNLIIFDGFVSLYDSNVSDRKVYGKFSIRAFKDMFLDWYSCKLSDKVLMDTEEHIEYFTKKYNVNINKRVKAYVGADSQFFYPDSQDFKNDDKFIVHFHGSYIPLQGVEHIIEATKILKDENIEFNIIGSAIKNKFEKLNLDNINFIENVDYKNLRKHILMSDICLGIFGKTDKAVRVIPNKVYEAIACRKPVITGESPAIKELFMDGENIILCEMGNPNNLTEKILHLKNNTGLRNKIANNGYNLFIEKLTPEKIVKKIIKII
ncbi:glycosyltransferase [Patescibacteria group bacterium]